MHPVIISVGWFNIYSFGLMLALSFLVGIYISAYRAKRFGVDPQNILDLSVYLILAGVLGSRLLYVLFHLDEYNSFVDIFALWEGGATLYGGFLLAIFAAAFFAKKKNIDFVLIADISCELSRRRACPRDGRPGRWRYRSASDPTLRLLLWFDHFCRSHAFRKEAGQKRCCVRHVDHVLWRVPVYARLL